MFKVILWDVDGTLLDFIAAEKVALKACFLKFGLGECTSEMHKRYSEINVKYWKRLERGEITKAEVLEGRFREYFEKENIDTSFIPELNKEYQLRLGDTVVFNDNSFDIVRSLKGKIRQYVVTNGTTTAQTRKLEKSKLGELMDGIYISDRIGYEKPDKRFFDKVFESTDNIKKDEIIIVGDSLTSDIAGGINAGIVTCHYNYRKEKNDGKVIPDYEIHNLNEIYNVINIK